jgi:hypothetical protein
MEASRRLTNWLRLACALVLSVGLSSAAASSATGSLSPTSSTPTITQVGVSAAAIHSVAVRSATVVRHATGKHQPPAMASGLAAVGVVLTGLAACAVLRRRNDPALRHRALSDGARAPPAVSCI